MEGLRDTAGEAAASFDARCLGIAALVPILEVFRRISFNLPIALSAQAGAAGCIAALIAGLLVALGLTVGFERRSGRLSARLQAGVGLALAAAGMACMLPCAVGAAPLGAGLPLLGYLLVGTSLPAVLLGWVKVLARGRGALGSLIEVCLSVLLGAMSMFAVVALDTALGLWCLLAACFLVTTGLLWWASGQPEDPAGAEMGAEGKPTPDTAPQSGAPEERGLLDVVRSSLTAPAMGLALGVFSWGVMAVPPMPYLHDHKAWVYLAGDLLALCVVAALVYALRGGARYSVMRQKMFFLLPVFAVFMSYFSFIRMLDADGALKNVLSVGYNMSMAGFFTLFCVSCAEQCREKGLAVEGVAGPALIVCTLSYGAGALLYETYGNTAMYFQIVLTTLYILGLAFISSHRASLNDDSRLEERCGCVSRKFGLSQREEEVLTLTVAGYSVARIAEELTISPETVRTHKKRIYAKLDVHRHEDLMRVVRAGGQG